MRVLFFNEGNLGSFILGQGQLNEAHRAGLTETPGLEARFAAMTRACGSTTSSQSDARTSLGFIFDKMATPLYDFSPWYAE